MPTVALTAQFVRQAECGAGRRKTDYFDVGQRGFLLEVRCSGGKTYYQRYTDERGRERQYKIGPADVLSLDQARRKAQAGAWPKRCSAPTRSRSGARLRGIPLLKDFVAERYLPYVRGYKSSLGDRRDGAAHPYPAEARRARARRDQDGSDLRSLINSMREDGYATGTMNRVIVILRYIYNLARKWKVPGGQENPAAGLSAGPDVQRNRFLSEEEAEALVRAIHVDENQTAARSIMLLLLTGGRRNEITHAKWDYVDWTNKTLLVPKSKSGRARVIALNQSAIALLTATPRFDGNPYIFPSPVTGRPSASLFFPWDRIRKRAGLEDVRLHDLRHSFASFLVNRGRLALRRAGLLGHLHARTTQRYAHLTQETLTGAAELVQEVVVFPGVERKSAGGGGGGSFGAVARPAD